MVESWISVATTEILPVNYHGIHPILCRPVHKSFIGQTTEAGESACWQKKGKLRTHRTLQWIRQVASPSLPLLNTSVFTPRYWSHYAMFTLYICILVLPQRILPTIQLNTSVTSVSFSKTNTRVLSNTNFDSKFNDFFSLYTSQTLLVQVAA